MLASGDAIQLRVGMKLATCSPGAENDPGETGPGAAIPGASLLYGSDLCREYTGLLLVMLIVTSAAASFATAKNLIPGISLPAISARLLTTFTPFRQRKPASSAAVPSIAKVATSRTISIVLITPASTGTQFMTLIPKYPRLVSSVSGLLASKTSDALAAPGVNSSTTSAPSLDISRTEL